MFSLILFFLFSLFNSIFPLNNNILDTNNNYLQSIRIIQNTPVENNIPLIIQEIDANYIDQNLVNNKNPINIPLFLPNNQNIDEVITNITIKINMTNRDPMCTKECCTGCQIQFLKLISQKNCIINICKCQIIEISHEEINFIRNKTNVNNDKEIIEDNIFMFLNLGNKDININDINKTNFYYWFILLVFISFESYILYNLYMKKNIFNTPKENYNNLVIENDKEKRINDYMELLYGDEELIESLI